MYRSIVVFLFALTAACSPDPSDSPDTGGTDASSDVGAPIDAADTVDAGADDDGGTNTPDASTAPDADAAADDGGTDSPDMPAGDCDADCRTIDATVTVDGETASFERAYFGVTAGEFTDSGEPELHVEVYAGGADGCPSMDSPSPDQTLIVTGMRLPDVSATSDEAGGMAVSLLDFAGDLTMAPVLSATGESLTFTAWQCADCTDDVERYLAFDLDAPIDGGEAVGHVFATHCDSLDQ